MLCMDLRRLRTTFGLSFLLGLVACGGGGQSLPAVNQSLLAPVPVLNLHKARNLSANGISTQQYVAIDAGGPAASGNWIADTGYQVSGWGGIGSVASIINTKLVSNPAPQAVYQTQRYAQTVTYVIPKLNPSSAYTVRLHFVESYWTGPGKRLFNVSINALRVLSAFDIFQASGGLNNALVKEFTVNADAAGAITIQLVATVDRATIAGIEVISQTATPMPSPTPITSSVIAIDAGGVATGTWIADTDYKAASWSGNVTVANVINIGSVSNPAPQAVYQSQRFSPNITYTIPGLIPSGAYTVRLHFVESFWRTAGARLFNVVINGNQLLSNFDVFASSGGMNTAIVKEFAVSADAGGSVTVQLIATKDNAAISGIEVLGSGSSTPTPIPTSSPTADPTPTAPPTGDVLPSAFAQEFSASSPLRTALANLPKTTYAAGSSTEINAWNIEVAGGSAGGGPFGPTRKYNSGIPVYVNGSGNVLVTVAQCAYWNCGMAGTQVHVNPNDLIQGVADQHLLIIDPSLNVEVDCWQTLARSGSQSSGTGDLRPDLSGNKLVCGYGGAYALGSTGLSGSFNNEENPSIGQGIHFGPAAGLFFVTPNEMLNGHIDHALALNANCANNPMIYPANDTASTDTACYGGGSSSPHYGDAFQLNWSSSKIAASSHSKECKAIYTAMATYGAYIADTGDQGSAIDVEDDIVYHADPGEMGSDPYPAVLRDLQAAGDADGSGYWTSCFNGLVASDFNLVELTHP